MNIVSPSLDTEIRKQYCQSLAELLVEDGADLELLELIEDEGYLIEQARFTRSLAEVYRTLLQFALPAAARLGDHQRLLTYGAALLHVVRLGDSLVEARLLEDLMDSERSELAHDVIGRLTDPYVLGRSCAILLRSQPSSPLAKLWSDRAEEAFLLWLQRGCPEAGDAAVVEILSVLGERLDHLWPIELESRSVDWAGLHGATALAYLGNGPITAFEAWRHIGLASIKSVPELAEALVSGLREPGASWQLLRQRFERTILDSPRVGWPLLSTVFSLLEKTAIEAGALPQAVAEAFFEAVQQIPKLSFDWARHASPTADQIWLGRRLFAHWMGQMPIELHGKLNEAGITLEMVSSARDEQTLRESNKRIEGFLHRPGDMATWFRVATRWVELLLTTYPPLARPLLVELRKRVAAGVRIRDAEDVLRLLVAIAQLEPRKLNRGLRLVFVANPSLELLFELARRVRQLEVMDALIEEVEGLALLTTENQLESFRVRRDVLELVLRNLLSGTDEILDAVAFDRRLESIRLRLLKEEWADLLDRSVAVATAASRAERLVPFLEAAGSRRGKVLAVLRFGSGKPSRHGLDSGDPMDLVRDFSTIDRIEDELEALETLSSVPLEIDATVEELINRIQDEEIRQMTLLRYAGSAIRKEEEQWGQLSDRRGIVLGVQRALVTSSPLRLATLTPTLIELGSRMDSRSAAAETIEGMLQLMNMTSVSPSVRLDVLEDLIQSSVRSWLRSPADSKGPRQLGGILQRALRIPLAWPNRGVSRPEETSVECVSKRPGLRLWPLVIANLEMLPSAWQQGSASWTYRCRALFARPHTLQPWWRRTLQAFPLRKRDSPHAAPFVELCLAPPNRRAELVRSLWRELGENDELSGAAALLLGHIDLDLAIRCLERIPRGARRDRLSQHLLHSQVVQHGGLPEAIEPEVGVLISTPEAASRILLLARSWGDEETCDLWCEAIANGALDPVDPEIESLSQRLRQDTAEIPRERFEAALLSAAGRGALPLERALRLYLHYCLGKEQFGEQATPWAQFAQALADSREVFSRRHRLAEARAYVR